MKWQCYFPILALLAFATIIALFATETMVTFSITQEKDQDKVRKSSRKAPPPARSQPDKTRSKGKNRTQEKDQDKVRQSSRKAPPPARSQPDKTKGKKPTYHFFLHIAKTGGKHLNHMANTLLFEAPQWMGLESKKKMRLCNGHFAGLRFPDEFPSTEDNITCGMWSFESSYKSEADHVYTIVRNPVTHVLSQYFHCTESNVHKKFSHLMPSLDEWLEYWYDVSQRMTQQEIIAEYHLKNNDKFHCYNPVNFQTSMSKLDHDILLEGNNARAIEHIKSRFDIIGDQSQMAKAVCATVALYSGILPPKCDCSSLHQNQRRVQQEDHGVTHHGDTFNVTKQQREWIEAITMADLKLYEYSKLVFEEQLKAVEDKFGVQLCELISE